MEKFSKKEKIALTVFGVILLAIIVQMIWQLGETKSLSETGAVITGKDLPVNLLQPGKAELTASSHNAASQTVDKLIDGKDNTFWHIKLKNVGKPAWVKIDLGAGNSRKVHTLVALPRKKFPRQFFCRAELFGSDNGQEWKPISKIIQGKAPRKAEWRKWTFKNDHAYRYYKFLITDGHEDRTANHFYSLAELALFE